MGLGLRVLWDLRVWKGLGFGVQAFGLLGSSCRPATLLGRLGLWAEVCASSMGTDRVWI